MLEKYFSAPKTLARLRSGLSGPYIDGFAEALEEDGYSQGSAVRYLRAAAHLGHFLQGNGSTLADIGASTLDAFYHHLPRCHCPFSNGGRANHHVFFGVKRFRAHLFQRGVCQTDPVPQVQNPEPALVASFREWFERHRGAAESTLRQYSRGAADLLNTLGEDLSQWNAQQIRTFLLDRAKQCGDSTAEKLITAMRAFLRYLSFRGCAESTSTKPFPRWRIGAWHHCRRASNPRKWTV